MHLTKKLLFLFLAFHLSSNCTTSSSSNPNVADPSLTPTSSPNVTISPSNTPTSDPSTSPTTTPYRTFFMGVGPIWKNYSTPTQNNMLEMYQKVSSFGEILIVQGNWRDSAAADGLTIPSGISPYLTMASTYNYVPLVGINFFKEELGTVTVYLDMQAPKNTTNNWSNTDAQTAYTNTVFTILNSYHPQYLALGIEVNTYWEHDPTDFDRFVTYYKALYNAIKSVTSYNNTKVFVTFQLEKLKRKGLSGAEDWTPFTKFAGYLDLAVFTTYPELFHGDPTQIPNTYYSELSTKGSFTIPIGFSELGWTAVGNAQEVQLSNFINRYFQLISNLNVTFVNWAFMHDLDSTGPLTQIGLYTSSGVAKSGLSVWTSVKQLPKQ